MKVGPRVYGYSHNWTFFQVVSKLVQSTLSKNRGFCYYHGNLPYRDEGGEWGGGREDVIFGGDLSIRRLNSNRKLIDLLQMCFTTELESL